MPPCTPVKPTPAARKYLSMTSWQREMHGFFNSSRKLALERNCPYERISHRSRGTHSASGQSALSGSQTGERIDDREDLSAGWRDSEAGSLQAGVSRRCICPPATSMGAPTS